MNFTLLFDLSSMLFVLISIVVSFIIFGKHPLQALKLAKDLAISIGVSGSLLGFVSVLSHLEDSKSLGPAVSIALLPLIYGIILSGVLYLFTRAIPHSESAEPTSSKWTFMGCGLLISAQLAHFMMTNHISFEASIALLLEFQSFIIMGISTFGIARITATNTRERLIMASRYALPLALLLILCSCCVMIAEWGDPSKLGPALAFGILSLWYANLIYQCAQLSHRAQYAETLPRSSQTNIALIMVTVVVIIGSHLMLLNTF